MSTVKMENSNKMFPVRLPLPQTGWNKLFCFALVVLPCIWKLNAVLMLKGEPLLFGY